MNATFGNLPVVLAYRVSDSFVSLDCSCWRGSLSTLPRPFFELNTELYHRPVNELVPFTSGVDFVELF